jgi:SRSO17 transposase
MSWARAASVEQTLALWAASLREIKQRIRPLFTQERVATNAGLFLEGLLGDEQGKTGWMRAEAAGDPGPWRQQAFLGRGDWDADALRDIVREYVIEHLADDDAVLVIDETGFLKQGNASCGVARQYTGSAGKITNCQIGVFAAYVSRQGHAFIDRALYLPKERTDDLGRLEAAYVPPDASFATKPKLAMRMIARAIAASVPFKWVAGDTVYGVGDSNYARRAKATRGQQRSCVSILGQAAIGRRQGRGLQATDLLATHQACSGRRQNHPCRRHHECKLGDQTRDDADKEPREELYCGRSQTSLYNPKRRHSAIGYFSPMEFERQTGFSLSGCQQNRVQLNSGLCARRIATSFHAS